MLTGALTDNKELCSLMLLQKAVNHLVWILGTELRSSVKATSTHSNYYHSTYYHVFNRIMVKLVSPVKSPLWYHRILVTLIGEKEIYRGRFLDISCRIGKGEMEGAFQGVEGMVTYKERKEKQITLRKP